MVSSGVLRHAPVLGRPLGDEATAMSSQNSDLSHPPDLAHPIEESFRSFAESLSSLVWSARPDGYTEYCNRRLLDYLGRTLGQVRGRAWIDALHPDDRERSRLS